MASESPQDIPPSSPLTDEAVGGLTDEPAKPEDHSRTLGSARTSVAKIRERLENEFMGIGMFVYTLNEEDGKAIMEGSEKLADSLAAWAQDSPRIRKWLEGGISSSHLISVIGAFSAIAVPIMKNHNMLPDFGSAFEFPEVPSDDGDRYVAGDTGTNASS